MILILMSGVVNAGQIKVTWHEPEKYRDVAGADERNKRFQKKTFSQFEKYFSKMAQKLPEEVTIQLKVTDLDLAGDVRYNFALHREIRLVSHIYWPMMEFDYEINSGSHHVASGTAKLKDMAFMDRGNVFRGSHRPLSYETHMLSTWFKKDVQTMLHQWQKHHTAVMSD